MVELTTEEWAALEWAVQRARIYGTNVAVRMGDLDMIHTVEERSQKALGALKKLREKDNGNVS